MVRIVRLIKLGQIVVCLRKQILIADLIKRLIESSVAASQLQALKSRSIGTVHEVKIKHVAGLIKDRHGFECSGKHRVIRPKQVVDKRVLFTVNGWWG